MVEQAAREVNDVKVYQIDLDKNQETPSQFGIMTIPALLFFKNGKEVSRLSMAKKEQIVTALKALRN